MIDDETKRRQKRALSIVRKQLGFDNPDVEVKGESIFIEKFLQIDAFELEDELNLQGGKFITVSEEIGAGGKRKYFVTTFMKFSQVLASRLYFHEQGRAPLPAFYEVIRESKPAWLYFDLEFKYCDSENNINEIPHNNILGVFLKCLLDFSISELSLRGLSDSFNEENVILLDSCTKEKFSYHIIIKKSKVSLFPSNVVMGIFVNRFIDYLITNPIAGCLFTVERSKILSESNQAENWTDLDTHSILKKTCIIDSGVYTKNRCFRTMNCSKLGKDTLLLPHDKVPKFFNLQTEEAAGSSKLCGGLRTNDLLKFVDSLVTFVDITNEVVDLPDVYKEENLKLIKKTNLSVRSRKDLQKHNCDLKTTTWKGNSRDNEISRKSPLLEIAPFKSSSSQSLLDDIQFESECRMEISDYISKEWLRRLCESNNSTLHLEESEDDFLKKKQIQQLLQYSEKIIENDNQELPPRLLIHLSNNKFCLSKGAAHKSNGVFFEIFGFFKGLKDKSFPITFVQKCFDPDCKRWQSEIFQVPNNVWAWKFLDDDFFD